MPYVRVHLIELHLQHFVPASGHRVCLTVREYCRALALNPVSAGEAKAPSNRMSREASICRYIETHPDAIWLKEARSPNPSEIGEWFH